VTDIIEILGYLHYFIYLGAKMQCCSLNEVMHTRKCNARKPARQQKMQNYVVPLQVSVLVLSKPLIRKEHAYVFGDRMVPCSNCRLEMWLLDSSWHRAYGHGIFLLESTPQAVWRQNRIINNE